MTRFRTSYQPYPIYTTVLTGKNLPAHLGYRTRIPQNVLDVLAKHSKPETPPGTFKETIMQTMFRESEAQTDPYSVEVSENTNRGLEILTMGWLSWNNGLPAGLNEIQMIERARQRRKWEAALPTPFDQTTRDIRSMVLVALDVNEWNYREGLISAINSIRTDLAEKAMKEKTRENRLMYECKVYKYIQIKKQEKNDKIVKLRLKFNRQIRKLVAARKNNVRKYQRWDIFKQLSDKTSEWYAPQMRFGEDPRHRHEKIHPKASYWRVFRKLEILHHTVDDVPNALRPAFNFDKKSKPRPDSRELCIRMTKWTEPNLEKLQDQLRIVRRRRDTTNKPSYLKKKVERAGVEEETPFVEATSDAEEELFQACLLLQKTIKGRAIQAVMFEGRVKCQELIEELKSTHALQSHSEDMKAKHRMKIYGMQRQIEIEQIQENRKREIICALEGKTTSKMLDFLAKELMRLQDERRTHALALIADQERHKREAAEAGRRQVEEQRRREHDEMFKQITKMVQNTVREFLEDEMNRNIDWLVHRVSRKHIAEVGQKIEKVAAETAHVPMFTRSDDLKEEEIIADLVYNFALPEAEKRLVRERLQARQKNYLKICHDEVYSNIENAMMGKRTVHGKLLPLPLAGKHKIPPLTRVKYLRLKRMHESSSSSLNSGNSVNSRNSIVDEQFAHISKINSKHQTHSDHSQPHEDDKDAWSTGFSKQEVILKSEEETGAKSTE